MTAEDPSSPGPPRVVVVVLNLCREELTTECLESLRACGYPELQVLLVDNGSPDGSGERLRRTFPDVAYLQTGENLGFTGGNAVGFAWALEHGADYVLALNNDAVVEPGAVERLVRTAEAEERVGGVCPTITYRADPERVWYGGGVFDPVRGLGVHLHQGELVAGDSTTLPAVPREVSFLSGCAVLFPAEVLRRTGGFERSYFAYVEDVELSVRLRRDGYRLLHEPRARVRHDTAFDERHPAPFAIRLRDRNRRRLMRTHFGPLARLRFHAWFWPTRLARLTQYALRGDGERARALLKGATER